LLADFASNLADPDFTIAVTRKRRQAGTQSYGVYTPGLETSSAIVGVFIRGLESQELLPQSERTLEGATFYTSGDLRTVDAPSGGLADLVVNGSEVYEVRAVRDWPHGNYKECVLVKVGQ
jgi:hypothetical protein